MCFEKPINRKEYMFSSQYFENQFNQCPTRIIENVNFKMAGKTIIDFGCGHGIKTLSIALKYPEKEVIGVDITTAFNKAAEFSKNQLKRDLPENLFFKKITPGQPLGSFANPDIIYSWSVLEHIQQDLLPDIILDMHESLNSNGRVFTQIAPLYYSPFGSHLRGYIDIPWAHLKLDHHTLKKRVEMESEDILGQDEKNKRKWMFEQYTQLNRVTAEELEKYFIHASFEFERRQIIKTNIKPTNELLSAYNEEALITNELLFVTKKS